MRVQDLSRDWRNVTPREQPRPETDLARPLPGARVSEHGDQLDLSSSARTAISSTQTAGAEAAADETLAPERLKEIRQRIRSGYYSEPEVVEATASRIRDFYSR